MADTVFDVIVVGSGAAGLAAALAASVDGASVLVLEKSPVLGGTTAMSSAGTWVPANHHMRAAGGAFGLAVVIDGKHQSVRRIDAAIEGVETGMAAARREAVQIRGRTNGAG